METSTNYLKFTRIGHNRQVRPTHVNDLALSIQRYGYFNHSPIVVAKDERTGLFNIIDGQHRFYACKKLGIPVLYEELKTAHAQERIVAINANQRQWCLDDFAKFYAGEGNQDYIELLKLCNIYGLSISAILNVFKGFKAGIGGGFREDSSGKRPPIVRDFKNGRFYITETDRENFDKVIRMVDDIRGFSPIYESFQKSPSFVKSIVAMVTSEGYEHEKMLKSLSERSGILKKSPNTQVYMDLLSAVYNHKRKKKLVF